MLAQPPCGPNEVGVHVHVQHLSHHYIHYHCISSINTVFLFPPPAGLTKNLLPYSVTPPRPAGPTEAQRKIEELTRQLEEEIEQSEEHGEYFGRLLARTFHTLVTLYIDALTLLCRHLSHLRREGQGRRSGLPGHG